MASSVGYKLHYGVALDRDGCSSKTMQAPLVCNVEDVVIQENVLEVLEGWSQSTVVLARKSKALFYMRSPRIHHSDLEMKRSKRLSVPENVANFRQKGLLAGKVVGVVDHMTFCFFPGLLHKILSRAETAI